MLAERQVIRDPERWAYSKMLQGKHVNPLHLMNMMKREHGKRQYELMRRMCQASGQIAVSSELLTKYKRTKYSRQLVREGNKTFYLFDRRYCPADIGVLLDLQSEEVIYQ